MADNNSGDVLKTLTSGSRQIASARRENAVSELIIGGQMAKHSRRSKIESFEQEAGVILVRNKSGAAVPRAGVLGLDVPPILPADNLGEFQARVFFDGIIPTVSAHSGLFVVTLEPIASDKIGRAAISGVVPCQVYVASGDEALTSCDVYDDDTTQLEASSTGSAQILWKENGTGTVWAYVRLGRFDQAAAGTAPVATRIIGTPNTTVSNTTTTTTIIGAPIFGSLNLPANYWSLGKAVRTQAKGLFSNASGTVILDLFDSISSLTFGSGALTFLGAANLCWRLDAISIYNAGVVYTEGTIEIETFAGAAPRARFFGMTSVTPELTQQLDVRVSMSVASPMNSITQNALVIEGLT